MALIDCGNGVRLERAAVCRLSDGTTLVSDHYYPEGSGPWPTLLMRQPYGRDIASTVVYAHPVWFARHGYHVAIQDVRGRGGSSGEFYPFRHEAKDGAETIERLCEHPASNGRIGMYGFSYQGATQLLAAAEQPVGLQCIAPHMTATDLYHGWFYHHGALRLSSTLGWGIQMLREDARRNQLRAASDRLEAAWANIRAQAAHVPYGTHPAIADESLPSYVRDWFEHNEPGEYWSALDISTRIDRIQIPALHIAGWYDTYLEGSIAGYLALSNGAGSDFARKNQFLIAGPWVHIPWGDRVGELTLGEAANINTDEIWFAGSTTGSRIPGISTASLRFVISLWAPMNGEAPINGRQANFRSIFKVQAMPISRKGGGMLLHEAPEADALHDVFVYDPEVPVLAPGGAQAMAGSFDQSQLEMGKNNLLVYTSAPVIHETEFFGQPKIKLYASTSAPHADFTAKLARVTPTGKAEFLCIGIARSSWLFANTGYAVDKVHEWEFTLEPTAFVLAPGECIRLEIASSAFPLYDRNPSTAASPRQADQWNWARSTQQILHSQLYPSVLLLPVRGESGW